MIRLIPQHAAGQPIRWVLCFYRKTENGWPDWLVPGKYKHVSAMGYVRDMDSWLFVDFRRTGIDVIAARGDGAKTMMAYYERDADMLRIESRQDARVFFPFGFWCVPAIKHLIGLRSGALRPSALWRDCVRQGATVIYENAEAAGLPAAAGPAVADGAAARAG